MARVAFTFPHDVVISELNTKKFSFVPAVGPAGPAGEDGADGYTPVKGTDYWTEEDVAEMTAAAEAVAEAVVDDLSADVSDLKSAFKLHAEEIDGTTQSIAFDASGNVSQITHTANGVAVRTDVFTFGANTITEVRTLSTGESLTIVTNTDTLVTTVTYAAA